MPMNDSIFRKELAFVKPYSPGKPIEDVRRELGLERIEKLASNENPLGPSPLAVQAMKSELSRVHMYPDSSVLELRSAIAAANGLGPENVVVANGGEHVLYITAQTFIDEGDEAVIPYPSFDLYTSTITMMGGKCVIVPLRGQDHDFDAMLAAVGPRTKIVYVCNPNNPTGNIMPRAAFEAFVAKLPPRVVLFVDEAYYEYAAADPEYPHAIATLRARPNTVILRTFSKVAGIAGIRVGFALSSPEIVTQMLKTRGTFMCNRLAQAAALASMSDTEHLSRTLALNAESLGAMTEYFRKKGLDHIESRANFVFVDLKRDSREMFDTLLRRGVITRPGALWGWNTWLRVSSGSMEQTRYFLEALEAVL
jgi:histidinol-phosphate aminotransferase